VLSTAAPKNAQLILQEQELTLSGNANNTKHSDKHIESEAEAGYNDVFRRKWEYYFAYCEGAFATRTLGCTQLVFTRTYNEDLSNAELLA
ncbi:hypothetical protein IWW50_002972, partial [Coemansia erecta]